MHLLLTRQLIMYNHNPLCYMSVHGKDRRTQIETGGTAAASQPSRAPFQQGLEEPKDRRSLGGISRYGQPMAFGLCAQWQQGA